jgi:type VI secretion system protein ImpL
MMSLRRIFGLMLLFLFFEAVVAVLTMVLLPSTNVFLACVAMTALAAAVWLIFVLTTRVLARPRSSQAPVAPRPAAAPKPGGDAFAQEMAALVDEADRRLAATGQPSIAKLPLFLVIGPDGAGKTSALANSGLESHLLVGEVFRDSAILPTRSCNLWFASGSVFADVSGQIILEEPRRWEALVRALGARNQVAWWKKLIFSQVPAHDFRGVILVCDTGIFLSQDDPQRRNQLARKLQERLQNVGTIFSKNFPVYVIFSKADSLPHFAQFFAHLNEQENGRIVGATLPWANPSAKNSGDVYVEVESKRLTEAYGRLYAALADKRMTLLARENRAETKALAYEFPRELRRIRNEVVHFLVDTFRPNPILPGPRLRGFYFSAVRRIASAGSLRDPLKEVSVVRTGSADATVFFGASRQTANGPAAGVPPSSSRWAFLVELFNTIILKDQAGCAGPQASPRTQQYRNIAFAALTTLLLFVCIAWTNSWRHNLGLLRSIERHITEVAPGSAGGAPDSLRDLETIRAELAELEAYERDGAPMSFRWGLYVGHEQAGVLHTLYFSRFRHLLLDPMLAGFTSHFSQLSSTHPAPVGDVYSELKTYLMVTSGSCSPKQDALRAQLFSTRGSLVPLPPDLGTLADRQIQFYITEMLVKDPYRQQIQEDAVAVKTARSYLASQRGPETLLSGLVEQVNNESDGESLSGYAPNYAQVLSGPDRMAAAYTRNGWSSVLKDIHDHKLASAGEPCVVGTDAAVQGWIPNQNTEREVKNLYAKQYADHWKAFLDAHHVLAYVGFSDAGQKLGVLSDNNRSPLLALLYMISRNTDLPTEEDRPTGVEALRDNLADRLRTIGKKVVPAAAPPTADLAGPGEIKQQFQPVRAAVASAERDKWLNDANREYLSSLANLSDALAALGTHTDPVADQARYDRARQAKDAAWSVVKKLEQAFNYSGQQVDVAMDRLLEEPIANVKLPEPPVDVLKARANGAAREFCVSFDRLRRKYPFNPDSSDEASVEDLATMFAPKTGEFWRFVQREPFAGVLALQGKSWVQDPAAGQRFSPQFINSLTEFSNASEALFPDGGSQPHLDYRISLDETAKIPFDLEVDGHKIVYSGKPTKPIPLSWPSVSPSGAILTVRSAGLNLPNQHDGLWGLFHVLHAADGQPTPGVFTFSRFELNKSNVPLQDSKGRAFSLEIHVDSSSAALFGKGYFSKLQCVSRAVQ